MLGWFNECPNGVVVPVNKPLKVAEVRPQTLREHRKKCRRWIFIEDVLTTLGQRSTPKNRTKAAALLPLLGWEHVPLRTVEGEAEPGKQAKEVPASKPTDEKAVWVRTQTLWEIREDQEGRLGNPFYKLVSDYASNVEIEQPVSSVTVHRVAGYLRKVGRPAWAKEIRTYFGISENQWGHVADRLKASPKIKCIEGATRLRQYALPEWPTEPRVLGDDLEPYRGHSKDIYVLIEGLLRDYDEVRSAQVVAYLGNTRITVSVVEAVLKQIGWRRRGSPASGTRPDSTCFVGPRHPRYISRSEKQRVKDGEEAPEPKRPDSRSKKGRVLAAINDHDEGLISIQDLVTKTELRREVLRRLLDQMEGEGLVSSLTLGAKVMYYER